MKMTDCPVPAIQFSSTDLDQLHRQLVAWRRSRPRRCAVPRQVWDAATALAATHGPSLVAQTLHLDFYKIRARLQGKRSLPPAPAFVEIPWPGPAAVPAPGGACTVELSDAGGARLSMRLPGTDTAAVLALAQAFWGRRQ